MVSEKVGGAEGTKLDDDFRDLERVREASFCGIKRETSLTKAVGLVYFTHSTYFCGTSVVHHPLVGEKKTMKPFIAVWKTLKINCHQVAEKFTIRATMISQ